MGLDLLNLGQIQKHHLCFPFLSWLHSFEYRDLLPSFGSNSQALYLKKLQITSFRFPNASVPMTDLWNSSQLLGVENKLSLFNFQAKEIFLTKYILLRREFKFNSHAYQQALKIIKCSNDKEQRLFSGNNLYAFCPSIAVGLCFNLFLARLQSEVPSELQVMESASEKAALALCHGPVWQLQSSVADIWWVKQFAGCGRLSGQGVQHTAILVCSHCTLAYGLNALSRQHLE